MSSVLNQKAPTISAVCLNPHHGFSKQPLLSIQLLAGLGVEGDAHCGTTVQHLYLKRKKQNAPNRMQVHLLQEEVFADLAAAGHLLGPGELGENITTRGIDLLTLPVATRLHLGDEAVVELTGLRTPCKKIDDFQTGLMNQMVLKGKDEPVPARAGVMAIVLQGGEVRAGDAIEIERPAEPWQPLRFL